MLPVFLPFATPLLTQQLWRHANNPKTCAKDGETTCERKGGKGQVESSHRPGEAATTQDTLNVGLAIEASLEASMNLSAFIFFSSCCLSPTSLSPSFYNFLN